MNRGPIPFLTGLILLLFSAAGCSSINLAELRAFDPKSDGFDGHAARAYRDQALHAEAVGLPWSAVERLGLLAYRFSQGWVEPPMSVVSPDGHEALVPPFVGEADPGGSVDEEMAKTLIIDRSQLIDALARGARRAEPELTAWAQAAFDCRVEAARAGRRDPDCEQGFGLALSELEQEISGYPFTSYKNVRAILRCQSDMDGVKLYSLTPKAHLDSPYAEVMDRAMMESQRHPVCLSYFGS